VLRYRRPRRAQASTVGQLQVRIQGIHRESVRVGLAAVGTRRVVASRARTILGLPGAGRQPVLRDGRGGRADVEHDPVDEWRNRRLAVIRDDGERS